MDAHLNWQVEALWQQLAPLLPGISIEVLARAESTNTMLLERVRSEGAAGEPHHHHHPHPQQPPPAYGRRSHDMQPCLLVAEHQSQGRGRMGRSWISSAGGSLTFSLGLVLDMADWSGLSLAVGCAIADALEPPTPGQAPRLQLKWPNDIWLDGKKLGGILIETVPAGAQRMAIIGVGLNISELAAPRDAAPGQFGTGFAALTSFYPDDAPPTAPGVLATIAPALAAMLSTFPQDGFGLWLDAFMRRDLTLGKPVTVGTLEGISRGVDAGGALRVETADGTLHAVSSGELSLRLGHGA